MNLSSEINWYAVQTRPGAEAAAQRSLESLDLEVLFPKTRRLRQRSSSSARPAVKPLFPGYLFARFCPAQSLHSVRYSRGICRVLGAGPVPLPVEDEIIDDINARVADDGLVQLDEPSWQPGDRVEIENGPLQGWSGVFERALSDQRRIVILLNTVQHARVILERGCLREQA
jgi:transcriptional antiterminator RfaH